MGHAFDRSGRQEMDIRACRGSLVEPSPWQVLTVKEIRPHTITYYLNRRDPVFGAKSAPAPYVHNEIELIRKKGQDVSSNPGRSLVRRKPANLSHRQSGVGLDTRAGINTDDYAGSQIYPTRNGKSHGGRQFFVRPGDRLGTVSSLEPRIY